MAASPLSSMHPAPANAALPHELLAHHAQSHGYNPSSIAAGSSTSTSGSASLQQQQQQQFHPSTASTSGSSHQQAQYYHQHQTPSSSSAQHYPHATTTTTAAPSSSSAYTASSITNTTSASVASSSTSQAPTTASSTGTSIIPLTRTHGHHSSYPSPLPSSSPYSPNQHASESSASPAAGPSSSSISSSSSPANQQSQHQQKSQSSNKPTTSSFIREGDIIYENCPPPPTLNPVSVNRSYTILKEVGDGSFGTVWLADWHSPLALPKGTGPPGPSSRPEYKGKRLVALKRMKKAFEGGWDECMKLKELKSLRSIAAHPNIIPLYDAFLLPSTKELYFVFECMEGNLYQLTKSRKGRPLAAGLVASLLKQMLAGLHHIHQSGYFHRDMKPENLLITTTGLADYPAYIPPIPATSSSGQSTSGVSITNRPPEKDVVAIVKIADFGLARETLSKPPYTEYVSTRWYRAPEVILRSRDYSHPVDMWALGTILSEMVNLKPLFPGQSEVDQVFRICEVLGDPTTDYGKDENGRIRGGGYWERSIKMAKSVGFSFPKIQPINFYSLYDKNLVPLQLIDMMADLMRYDPKLRLTTLQCLDHPYFKQITPLLEPTPIPAVPNHIRHQQQQQQQQVQAQAQAQQIQQQQQQQKVYSLPTPSSAQSYGLPAPNSASFPSPRNIPSSHTQASQFSRQGFEQRHHYPSGMSQPAPGSATSYQSASQHPQGYPHPNAAQPEYQQALQQQQRERQASVPHSLISNESVGLGSMHVVHGGSAPSPAVGYPESVMDVSMDGDETMSPTSVAMNGGPPHHLQMTGRASPAPSSVYSFGREGSASLPPPHISHQQASPQLPPPHTHHYASSYQQQLRQGVNGYPSSTHSGSLYNPSVYSGISAHSGGSGGRRGSAGGASTFYDGSIFEGIAPTRAASILSLPVTYGEAPPSPNFALPHNHPSSIHSHQQIPSNLGPGAAMARHASLRRARNDADNVSVDFEREALQRSQNSHPSAVAAAAARVPKSDSQDSLKASNTKGKKSWMSNLLGSNNNDNSPSSSSASIHKQPQYHPQQQPLINPSNYAPSASSSASVSHFSVANSGSSLKRTPSERSIHALEQPPTQPQQPTMPLDPKKAKKEAERLAKEAEKAKREAATKAARERARAVMQKRNALAQAADPLHSYGQQQSVPSAGSSNKALSDKEKKALLDQRKQQSMMNGQTLPQIAEDPRSRLMLNQYSTSQQYAPDARYKARRRDVDDDVHSMSSNETRSERRFSISSQNTMSTVSTMDSDPGPPRPGRQGGFLAPLRRSPSASSFSGQSHLSVGSTGSGHAPASGYGRRDLGTSGSGTSSLEYGLVGRFKGLSAADAASSSTSPTSASSHSHSESPLYFRPPHSPSQVLSQGHPNHQPHNISLPPIQSFDRPPPKEFSFNDTTHSQNGAPQTSHSNHSNNSTISANSRQYHNSSGQLPFTPEMYHHHQMQQSQQQQ